MTHKNGFCVNQEILTIRLKAWRKAHKDRQREREKEEEEDFGWTECIFIEEGKDIKEGKEISSTSISPPPLQVVGEVVIAAAVGGING